MSREDSDREGSPVQEGRVMTSELKGLISKEVAEALEKALPFLLKGIIEEVTETIREVISEEFRRRDDVTCEKAPLVENQEERQKLTYKDFMACKPPEYYGETDPIKCMRWLSEIEGAFEVVECPNRLKVKYAASLLRSNGKEWWDFQRQTMGADVASGKSWNEFKKMVESAFCLEAELTKIRRDFIHMRQTSETVNELAGVFLERARFCPEYAENPKRLMSHFLEVLKKDIRQFCRLEKWMKFEDLVNEARNREIEISRNDDRSLKRKAVQQSESSKRAKYSGSSSDRDCGDDSDKDSDSNRDKISNSGSGNGSDSVRSNGKDSDSDGEYSSDYSKGELTACETCHRKHIGECLAGTRGCYQCGKEGHIKRDCPESNLVCFICYEQGHIKKHCPKL